jgi:hypothetical protein
MGPWIPVRQTARIATHLDAAIEIGEQRHYVKVLSVGQGGVYCEGLDLEPLEESFRLELCLEPGSPAWSPSPGAAGWRSRMCAGVGSYKLRVEVHLLYVDLAERDGNEQAKVGLGGRFIGLTEHDQERLNDFIARESFRATEWRTAGGAVPASRHPVTGTKRDH